MSERCFPGGRRGVALVVAVLCVASIALKAYVNAPRSSPGYGDVAYYTTLALNLAEGRGFVLDYVPDFLSGATSIPAPANTYWMPLVSIVCALGMLLFGATFGVAQGAMIAVTGLAPWLVYVCAKELFGSVRVSLVAAALSVAYLPFLTPASQPVTHGLVLMCAGTCLWWLVRALRDVDALRWVGVWIALAHLNRSDGVLLFAVLGAVLLFRSDRRPVVRPLAICLAGYALVMAPFWVHSMWTTGSPMPDGPGRAAFLLDYRELYSLPERLTLERYLDAGWAELIDQRWRAFRINAVSVGEALFRGQTRPSPGAYAAGLWLLCGLAVAGLGWMRSRAWVPALVWLAVSFGFYTLLFPLTGLASFRASFFALYPFVLAGAARALVAISEWVGRRWSPLRGALLVAAVACTGWGAVGLARAHMEYAGRWIDAQRYVHWQALQKAVVPLGLEDETFLSESVHQVHANTGLRLVSLPFESEPVLREVAERYDAGYILLFGRPELGGDPTYVTITQSDDYELLFAQDLGGERVRLFRLPESPN